MNNFLIRVLSKPSISIVAAITIIITANLMWPGAGKCIDCEAIVDDSDAGLRVEMVTICGELPADAGTPESIKKEECKKAAKDKCKEDEYCISKEILNCMASSLDPKVRLGKCSTAYTPQEKPASVITRLSGDQADAKGKCACVKKGGKNCKWINPKTGQLETAPENMTLSEGSWSGTDCIPKLCIEFEEMVSGEGAKQAKGYSTPKACK